MGYSPTPRQHFWKTAAPKNFLFACGSVLAVMRFWCNVSCETWFLGNHPNPVRQGWGTSPACLGIAIAPETLSFITTFLIWRQLRFFRFVLRFLFHFIMQFDLLRKCGLLAHTSPTFLKICWIKKLFILSATRILQPIPHKTKPADPCFRQESAGFFVSKCS